MGHEDAAGGPFVVYFDGASRGNPGPAAWAIWSPSGVARSGLLGRTTNNVAEWHGFLAALDAAAAAGAAEVDVRADSELVVKQWSGEYRVKAPHLAPLLARAREKAAAFRRVRVSHVPRGQNREADRLANRALDAARDGG